MKMRLALKKGIYGIPVNRGGAGVCCVAWTSMGLIRVGGIRENGACSVGICISSGMVGIGFTWLYLKMMIQIVFGFIILYVM